MKKLLKVISALLCMVMMVGMFGGCQGKTPNATPTETPKPMETPVDQEKGEKDGFSESQIAEFYNEAIKVGYTEEFKYTSMGYTVGSGDEAEDVNYFQDLVRGKFPNAEFFKIEDQYNTEAIIAANCDVLFGLNTYALQALKKNSALKEFEPEWAAEVGANLNDKDNQYFAIAKDMIISVYRMTGVVEDSADLVKQQDVETFGGIEINDVDNVTDLWKEGSAYIGKYELDRYSSDWNELANKTFLVGLLSNYIDKNATSTDFVSQEGWDQLQSMINGRSGEWDEAETKKNVCNTGDYINNIANTQISIDYASDAIDKMAWYWAAGKLARLDVIDYAPVPTFIYGAAITATTTKTEASQLFMDYIGASTTVLEMTKHVRTLIPANQNVFTETNVKEMDENGSSAEYKDYTAALDEAGNTVVRIIPTRQYMLPVSTIDAQEIDWDFVCEHLDAWIERANAMVKDGK